MELTLLKKLCRLDIEDNRVYGMLLSELAALSELEKLRCQNNDCFSAFQLIMAIWQSYMLWISIGMTCLVQYQPN
jgi:hypothetical protein